MKLLILVVAAIIIAGHFVPVSSKQLYASACSGINNDVGHYSVLLGKLNRFKNLTSSSAPNLDQDIKCSQEVPAGKAKLYLW